VVSVTDGIVRIHGLADARYGEMLEFAGNTFGLALNLEQDSVGAVVLGDYKHISEGDRSRPRAAFSKCRWARSCWAAWSTRWATPSTARARSTPPDRAAGARGAGRHFPQERVAAGADRPQGHRLHGARSAAASAS
jgi:hypothetical protein